MEPRVLSASSDRSLTTGSCTTEMLLRRRLNWLMSCSLPAPTLRVDHSSLTPDFRDIIPWCPAKHPTIKCCTPSSVRSWTSTSPSLTTHSKVSETRLSKHLLQSSIRWQKTVSSSLLPRSSTTSSTFETSADSSETLPNHSQDHSEVSQSKWVDCGSTSCIESISIVSSLRRIATSTGQQSEMASDHLK